MAASPSFSDLCQKKYADQAIWFLNGFWNRGMSEQNEVIWLITQEFIKLDENGAEGNELSEFDSHKFLELLDETMTVLEMRAKLREIDTDANGQMALMEYLSYRYGFTPDECAAAPQGDNSEELQRAQALFDEVMSALDKQRQAVAELEEAEAVLAAAEAELEAAIAELNAEEEAYHGAIAAAEAKANDDSLGVVKRNRAKNEVAQLKSEDPLPLRKAKITQEAALRKVGKEKKKVQAKKDDAEAVQAELEAKLEEASAELKRVQESGGGTAEGGMWWMHRIEIAADYYKPQSRRKFGPEIHNAPPVSIKVPKDDE